MKFAWKVQRDVAERGWTEDQVELGGWGGGWVLQWGGIVINYCYILILLYYYYYITIIIVIMFFLMLML